MDFFLKMGQPRPLFRLFSGTWIFGDDVGTKPGQPARLSVWLKNIRLW